MFQAVIVMVHRWQSDRAGNKTPEEISDYYHNEFVDCFNRFGFTFDLYGKTSSNEHKKLC